MKARSVKKYTKLQHMAVGPFAVKQPFPNEDLAQVSPFLLLHHAGPQRHEPGAIKARLSPHPHRGFEPVTFLFSGNIHHKDSTGAEGFLEAGDVQWMTAGSGIIHSEGPSAAFANEGGEMELVQLWVNLPRDYKMTAPKYQDIKKKQLPVIAENGFELHLVAGRYGAENGPASTFSPLFAATIYFGEAGEVDVPISFSNNALLYVLDGEVEAGGETFERFNLGIFENNGDAVCLKAKKKGKALLLAGEPINEPVSSYGPFVMNYPGEIKQAVLDYQEGRMGLLSE